MDVELNKYLIEPIKNFDSINYSCSAKISPLPCSIYNELHCNICIFCKKENRNGYYL